MLKIQTHHYHDDGRRGSVEELLGVDEPLGEVALRGPGVERPLGEEGLLDEAALRGPAVK